MIIVTGATGFIGSATVWQLNQNGLTDILCVDSVPPRQRNDYLSHLKIREFVSADELWSLLSSGQIKPSWIIHMGACSSTTEMNREFLYENNFMYSVRLWNWCKESQCNYIYASSAATYGAGELGYCDSLDSEQLRPLNPYGESKVIFDRWVRRQTSSPSHWYGLKFFNVYGPNEYHKEFQASVAYKAYYEILKNRSLKLFRSHKPGWADGRQKRDFVYVKDVTRWICELMQLKPKSDIYNMGYGEARTWLDLANAGFQSLGLPSEIDFIDMPESIRDTYQYFTEANISKLLENGLSNPQWSIERGVADYYDHLARKDWQGLQ